MKIHKCRFKLGDTIDNLTVVAEPEIFKVAKHYDYKIKCKCKCGKEIMAKESVLCKTGRFHSCGCLTIKNLRPGDAKLVKKAGKFRAIKRNKDNCNVDMLFRKGTIVTNTSGEQGVSWSKINQKWHVYVGYQRRRATLGYFTDFEEATKIRKLGLEAVKNGTFEEFFFQIRGKDYKTTYKETK